MILHTPVPCGMIMETLAAAPPPEYCRSGGQLCQVSGGRVERLISTDPNAFLEPGFQPGAPLAPNR